MFSESLYKSLFEDKLQAIDDCLRAMVRTLPCPKPTRDWVWDVVSSGRRFRPLLMFIVHEGFGGSWRTVLKLSCGVELLHKASLIHDDIVDGDASRRGKPAVWKTHGRETAIILGDLLIGQAFVLAADSLAASRELSIRAYHRFAEIVRDTSVGELLDLGITDTVGPKAIETMLRLKSGTLVAASMELGAAAAGASAIEREICWKTGEHLGVAFQIRNDINNVNGVDITSKCRLGTDLEQKRQNYVTSAFTEANVGPERLAVLTEHERTELLHSASAQMNRHLQEASAWISRLPESEMQQTLLAVVDSASADWFWINRD